jgi:azurin
MRRIYLFFFAAILLLGSCGQGSGNQNSKTDSAKNGQLTENNETSVPGIEKLEFTDSIKLKANENMKFDNELFRVKSGKKLRLLFKNTGTKTNASMSHNVVILKKGIDIADFADVARTAKNEQYVPSSLDSLIIAHTNLVNAGESAEVEFTIPEKGVYDFICSFPGHWGTMQGKIVAE